VTDPERQAGERQAGERQAGERQAGERQAGEPGRRAGATAGLEGSQDRRQPPGQLLLLDEIASNKVVQTYLALADQFTAQLGYTEHGFRHANLVGRIAFNILDRLGHDRHVAELAAVAGHLHDVGNVISRHNHPQSSALIAMPILAEVGLATEDIGLVIGAIGNHEEELGHAVSPVAAAVVIADKSDVHRSRVRKDAQVKFDIHDRVNFSATHSFVRVDADQRTVTLELEIDTEVSDILEYFEIFLTRMMMCRRAAEGLGCKFRMTVNGQSLL
jgi:metal-dependent HD superfamily phosphatase/phosphodiesterase